ncbi:hypothetical protein WDZ92_31050, partial [Nostoc sp. NIES-2111]
HWDPAMIILICCDRFVGLFAKETDDRQNLLSMFDGNYHILDRSGEGRGPSCNPLWSIKASSTGFREEGRVYNHSQIISSEIHLGVDERITSINSPFFAITRRLGKNMLLTSTTFQFDTTENPGSFGYTNYPILPSNGRLPDVPALSGYKISDVEFKSKEKGRGEVFSFSVNSQTALPDELS